MLYLWGCVVICSNKSLEEVAQQVSKKLFGGLPFVGREQHIMDEVPAVCLEGTPLGLYITLAELHTPGQFELHVRPWTTLVGEEFDSLDLPKEFPALERVDMSEWIRALLFDLEGASVSVRRLPTPEEIAKILEQYRPPPVG